jgi:nucleolar complex protein 2
MGKKANKASRKYAASGQLKKEIQARRKHQQVKRTIERRKGAKAKPVNGVNEIKGKGKGKGKEREVVDDNEDDDVEMSEEDEENVGK